MDEQDRTTIDDLFGKVEQAEREGGPRDPDAEALIEEHLKAQPAAPYYMAQAIVTLEDALAQANERIQTLEAQAARQQSPGFLQAIFGGSAAPANPAARPPSGDAPPARSLGNGRRDGFLGQAGATGMIVAGSALAGYMIGSSSASEASADQGDGEQTGADGVERPGEGGDFGDGDDMGGGDFDLDF